MLGSTDCNITRSWSWWWAGCEFPSVMNLHCGNGSFPPHERNFSPSLTLACWEWAPVSSSWGELLPAPLKEATEDASRMHGLQFCSFSPVLWRETPWFQFDCISGFQIWSKSASRGKKPKTTLQYQWILLIQSILTGLCRWDIYLVHENTLKLFKMQQTASGISQSQILLFLRCCPTEFPLLLWT